MSPYPQERWGEDVHSHKIRVGSQKDLLLIELIVSMNKTVVLFLLCVKYPDQVEYLNLETKGKTWINSG